LIVSLITSSTDIKARQRFLKEVVTYSAHCGVIILFVATTPWWNLRLSAEQFQETGRGSCAGQELSQWSAYQVAGEKGSWHALGAMYTKNGLSCFATFLIQERLVLPTTAVV
jgi:hypothetical protein